MTILESKRFMLMALFVAIFGYVLFGGIHDATIGNGTYAVWHPWVAAFFGSAWCVTSILLWIEASIEVDKMRAKKMYTLTDEEAEILEAIRSKK
jgi:hypothetical protein